MRPEEIQRQHYAQTAVSYNHELGQTPEHELALYFLLGFIDSVKAASVLDVGAGTGRAVKFLMELRPNLTLRGVEPIEELRQVGFDSGIPRGWLIPGGGYELPFPDGSFDVVTEFGVLHHVEKPELLVREMLRVARYGVFISDTNNLGQGSLPVRLAKSLFFWLGLWKLLSLIRTRGRGFVYEPNDGLWYYYTVFLHFAELRRLCHSVHVINTRRTSRTHWLSASHAVVMATKSSIVDHCPFFANLK